MRLYPEPDRKEFCRCYYEVKIFATRDEMLTHQAIQAIRKGIAGSMNFDAITMSFTLLKLKAGRWLRSAKVGEILFFQGGFGAGTVSHECTHAALHWSWRQGRHASRFRNDTNREERLCHVQGGLVTQFWQKYWKRWPDGLA